MELPSLRFEHGDTIEMLRDTAKGFARKEIAPRAAEIDRGNEFPADLWRKLGSLGLTLSEIRELIDMYEPGRDARPQLQRFLAVLEEHKAGLVQQRADIEAQLSEIQAFEKKVRKQLK